MKFTNQKIENMQNVLTAIGNKEINNPVLALKIARNNYNLTQALNPILKVKNDILRKYGEKDEKGKIVMNEEGIIRITDVPKYNAEITTLMNAETDVNIECFSEEDFDKMSATPNQLMTLLEIAK
jgi:hypothetical protein